MKGIKIIFILALLCSIYLGQIVYVQAADKAEDKSAESGIVFDGPIHISGKAKSGTISFVTPQSGNSVLSVTVTLKDLSCSPKDGSGRGVRLETWSAALGQSDSSSKEKSTQVAQIKNGKIEISSPGMFEIKGKLVKKNSATGTIHLIYTYNSYYPQNETWSCDLGTWNWEAKAK